MKCPWCGKLFDPAVASLGTDYPWPIYKCPHCDKLRTTEASKDPKNKNNKRRIKCKKF